MTSNNESLALISRLKPVPMFQRLSADVTKQLAMRVTTLAVRIRITELFKSCGWDLRRNCAIKGSSPPTSEKRTHLVGHPNLQHTRPAGWQRAGASVLKVACSRHEPPFPGASVPGAGEWRDHQHAQARRCSLRRRPSLQGLCRDNSPHLPHAPECQARISRHTELTK